MFKKFHLIVFIILFNSILFSGCGGSSKPTIVQNNSNISNSSPVITSTAVNIARIDSIYRYPVRATDIDPSSLLNFHLFSAPDGMRIDRSSGLISWTPTTDQLGNHIVIVQVKDNGTIIKAGYQSFKITVLAANNDNNSKLIAMPDYVETPKNRQVIIDVLENDRISSSLTERLKIATKPTRGKIKILSDETILYTPKENFSGLDSFSYMISNEYETQIAHVTIAVDCPDCNEDKTITLNWNPSVFGQQAGYLIYYGPDENTTNKLAYDLSRLTGMNEYSPSVQLSKLTDLRLIETQTVCFRISAYIAYNISELSPPICGTV